MTNTSILLTIIYIFVHHFTTVYDFSAVLYWDLPKRTLIVQNWCATSVRLLKVTFLIIETLSNYLLIWWVPPTFRATFMWSNSILIDRYRVAPNDHLILWTPGLGAVYFIWRWLYQVLVKPPLFCFWSFVVDAGRFVILDRNWSSVDILFFHVSACLQASCV